jgi:NADH-quinone oxidoreductase subunit L
MPELLPVIPLLPLLGFLVNALFGRRLPKSVSGALACGVMLAAFGVSAVVSWQLLALPEGPTRVIAKTVYTWIAAGDFRADMAFRLDPLAMLMILVVTGIGSLIHIYSIGYMHEETDSEYARYFSYLNLFATFMLMLVLGANLLVMFVGWEGVGLCSYLLIGFWFRKRSATDAGKKAFIVNRVGDFAFIIGIALAFVTFGTIDFLDIAKQVTPLAKESSFGVLSLMALLFFIGATGKSAQIPLYVWLPDAMEGPTPVSALIHAATMVTAGVYMIGRNAELFAHAPLTMEIVAVIGTLTALMAGTIGLVQNDIKRVLAYSTVSQLGYMFLAMGVGAFTGGIFHLYTHAFFKALLFLGSGAVIHALHGEQDMRHMGGLKQELPITYWTFLIGALAISGVPLLSGFFSKDEILDDTYLSGHTILWAVGMVTALLTAIYMFRLVFLTFHGPRAEAAEGQGAHGAHGASGGGHEHLHDAPPSMAMPLVILAVGSVLAGYVGVPHALGGSNRIETFLESSFHPASGPEVRFELVSPGTPEAARVQAGLAETAARETTELTLMGVSTVVALAGIGIGAYFFFLNRRAADTVASTFSGVRTLLLNKYYVDELYDAVIVQPIKRMSDVVLWRGVDVGLIDGTVNGVGRVVRESSGLLRLLQTGSVRAYAASLFLGVVLVLGYYLFGFR